MELSLCALDYIEALSSCRSCPCWRDRQLWSAKHAAKVSGFSRGPSVQDFLGWPSARTVSKQTDLEGNNILTCCGLFTAGGLVDRSVPRRQTARTGRPRTAAAGCRGASSLVANRCSQQLRPPQAHKPITSCRDSTSDEELGGMLMSMVVER